MGSRRPSAARDGRRLWGPPARLLLLPQLLDRRAFCDLTWRGRREILLLWLALSAAAILLERTFTAPPAVAPYWKEEDADDVLRTEQAQPPAGSPAANPTLDRQRPAVDPHAGPLPAASTDELEYVGERTLVVMGQATRRTYRFAGRGARLFVDRRDRASLARVPGLREVGHEVVDEPVERGAEDRSDRQGGPA